MEPASAGFFMLQQLATHWNRIRYTLYAPIYDLVAKAFAPYRRRSLQRVENTHGRILLIGAGTGLDLPYLPKTAQIVATDLTPALLLQLQWRATRLGMQVESRVMDGQAADLPDEQFDVVVLHLILAVIPNPVLCLQEAERMLKPGGQILIFDKFHSGNKKVGVLRKLVNLITSFLFSSINRRIEHLVAATSLTLVENSPAALGGVFRQIELRKNAR